MSPEQLSPMPSEARFGPITHRFAIIEIPEGGAPEQVRQNWVGAILPVRSKMQNRTTEYIDDLTGEPRVNPRAVTVVVEDAVVALIDQNRQDAANFWGSNFAPDDLLIFRRHEGILDPVSAP